MTLTVFDIQRFCIQDGPGIRTTVFLKGCPVRCLWCHNPESQRTKPELLFYADKCVSCGRCAAVCPAGAHRWNGEEHRLDRQICRACGKCAAVCPEDALTLSGYELDIAGVVKEIVHDLPFYRETGGGVTFSGGEPLLRAEALREVLLACHERGIHTAVETSMAVSFARVEQVIDLVDLFLCDVKAWDDGLHRRGTGTGNGEILDNIRRTAEQTAGKLWIRVPIIPGFNDSESELAAIGRFARSLGEKVERIEGLPYHDFGKTKYAALGRPYACEAVEVPEQARARELQRILEEAFS